MKRGMGVTQAESDWLRRHSAAGRPTHRAGLAMLDQSYTGGRAFCAIVYRCGMPRTGARDRPTLPRTRRDGAYA
eukprot:scaffold547_cov384-Prasinococcus_capsulatus_cf.AAC.9